MPQVGKKKFPYTEAGMKDAKMAAKKSGKKMVSASKKKKYCLKILVLNEQVFLGTTNIKPLLSIRLNHTWL